MQSLEELLLGQLERTSGHLGLGIGSQRQKVTPAGSPAHVPEKTKQVGLGDAGHF